MDFMQEKISPQEQPVKSEPTSIIGAAKGEFTLPPDFEEISALADKEIEEMFLSGKLDIQ